MPELSRSYGLIVRRYYADHRPAHFHVFYQEHEAVMDIDTLEVSRGSLPRRALGLVAEWGMAHRDELRQNWKLAERGEQLEPIPPLE